jgi:hypothetical protein
MRGTARQQQPTGCLATIIWQGGGNHYCAGVLLGAAPIARRNSSQESWRQHVIHARVLSAAAKVRVLVPWCGTPSMLTAPRVLSAANVLTAHRVLSAANMNSECTACAPQPV